MKSLLTVFLVVFLMTSFSYSQDYWQRINGPSCGYCVGVIAINSNGHIYVGTEEVGVYRSTDNGNSWIETGLTNDWINCLALNSSDRIYAATDGGIYRSVLSTATTKKISEGLPLSYKLRQNYPNPFNPSTTIEFDLPKSSDVRIDIYNIAGQIIQTLINNNMPAGNHQVEFNAENLSSGIYFCRIQTGEFQNVKRMVLLK